MRKIRPDSRRSGRAVDRVTANTAGLLEKGEALAGFRVGGTGGRNELCALPGGKFRRSLRDDEKMHPGMFGPTKFRADAEIGSRRVGLDPYVIRMAGDRVYFPVHLRHPKLMQYVGRLELHGQRPADGDVDLVCGRDAGLGITSLPPPLMAAHNNVGGRERG